MLKASGGRKTSANSRRAESDSCGGPSSMASQIAGCSIHAGSSRENPVGGVNVYELVRADPHAARDAQTSSIQRMPAIRDLGLIRSVCGMWCSSAWRSRTGNNRRTADRGRGADSRARCALRSPYAIGRRPVRPDGDLARRADHRSDRSTATSVSPSRPSTRKPSGVTSTFVDSGVDTGSGAGARMTGRSAGSAGPASQVVSVGNENPTPARHGRATLGGHPKPASHGHLKTGQ